MNLSTIFIAGLGMAGLGIFWAIILVIANKMLQVEEDPILEKVIELLPGANCGACGFAGCSAFGTAVVEKSTSINGCPVSNEESQEQIAKITGQEIIESKVKKVAKLHCSGTNERVKSRSKYQGYNSCLTEQVTVGGTLSCTYGCLGHGDCVQVCPFGAISMGDDGLPKVDESKCTACNKCVEECPRGLFKLVPVDQDVFILCSSKDPGVICKDVCSVSCIACKICEKQEPNVFKVENNLAYVHAEALSSADSNKIQTAIQKCPRKIITQKK